MFGKSKAYEVKILSAAEAAMSAKLTIGWEQVIVSLALLLVSLFLLSRPSRERFQLQWQRFIWRWVWKWTQTYGDNDNYDTEGEEDYENTDSERSSGHDGGCGGYLFSMFSRSESEKAEANWASGSNTPIRRSKSTPFLRRTARNYFHPSISSSSSDRDELLTDHERFAHAYVNHIQYQSEYRRLVLPPECQLNHPNKKDQGDNNDGIKHATSALHNLKASWLWFIGIMDKIISFDIMTYFGHFVYRIIKALECRFNKVLGRKVVNDGDEEEEEDDDGTVASNGSRRSLLSRDGSLNSSSVTMNAGSSGHHASSGSTTAGTGGGKVPLTPRQTETSEWTTAPINLMGSAESSANAGGKQRERFYTGDEIMKSPLRALYPITFSTSCDDISLDKSIRSLDAVSESNTFDDGLTEERDSCDENMNEFNGHPPTKFVVANFNEEKKESTCNQHAPAPLGNGINISSPPSSPLRSKNIKMNINMKSTSSSTNTLVPSNCESIASKRTKTKAVSEAPPMPILPRQSSVKQKDKLQKYQNPSKRAQSEEKASVPKAFGTTSAPRTTNSLTQSQTNMLQTQHQPQIQGQNQQKDPFYFDTANNPAAIQRLQKVVPMPDEDGYILGDQFLKDQRDTPLLVFVNTRSGSQQGSILKTQLRSLLNPIQIWDLADGGPEKILTSFSVFSRLRLLVCGGDGTVSWIISALDKMDLEKWPPIAILPLGTGNDLARIHGWGPGYANESLLLILNQVEKSYMSLLDRWTMKIEKKKRKKHKRKEPIVKPFINYMSIGMDALSALQVHNLRENSPNMFFSRAINKVWYALFGAEDAIKASCSDLPQQIILEANGVVIPIPPDSQGLIFLNIDSYIGGVPLWSRGVPSYKTRFSEEGFLSSYNPELGKEPKRRSSFGDSDSMTCDSSVIGDSSLMDEDNREESYEEKVERIVACDAPSSCQDGKLDVISYRGNFHLGQIRVGLSHAQKLCQCSRVKITMKKSIAIQADGEPWKQENGVLTIERQKTSAMMLHRALDEGDGIETEVANLLEWAQEKEVISHRAHNTLMKEFSRRVEKKTRDRRNRSQETVFSTMKKKIASNHRLHTMS